MPSPEQFSMAEWSRHMQRMGFPIQIYNSDKIMDALANLNKKHTIEYMTFRDLIQAFSIEENGNYQFLPIWGEKPWHLTEADIREIFDSLHYTPHSNFVWSWEYKSGIMWGFIINWRIEHFNRIMRWNQSLTPEDSK